jgi:hypothetical protein
MSCLFLRRTNYWSNMRHVLCKFILIAGLATFQFAALAQTAPPAITAQPTNQTVACGGDVTFSVTATGSTPLGYFWSADGQPLGIPATSASLTLTNILFGSGTRFTVVVSNAFGWSPVNRPSLP